MDVGEILRGSAFELTIKVELGDCKQCGTPERGSTINKAGECRRVL